MFDKTLSGCLMDFALHKEPLVVLDFELNAAYLNPAAIKNEVFLAQEKFAKKCLPAMVTSAVYRCIQTDRPQRILARVGNCTKRRFLVTMKKAPFGIVLYFRHRPDRVEEAFYQPPLSFQPERSALSCKIIQSMISAGEVLKNGGTIKSAAIGKRCFRQALSYLRLERELNYFQEEITCHIIDLSEFLRKVAPSLSKFMRESFQMPLLCSIPTGEYAVKCSVPLLRNAIFAFTSILLQLTNEGVFINCVHQTNPNQMVITIASTAKSLPKDIGSHLIKNHLDRLKSLDFLIQRMQGKMWCSGEEKNQLAFNVALPIADTGAPIKEHLDLLLNEDISSMEIEFSNLL